MPDSTWREDRKLVLETLKEIKEDVKAICYDLNGNGSPGLKSKVRMLCRDVRIGRWVVGMVVAALISGAVGGWVKGEMKHSDQTSRTSVQP